MTAFGLCTAGLLCMFCFKDYVNIPTSGLQLVIVVFEIGIAFVLCSSYGLNFKKAKLPMILHW